MIPLNFLILLENFDCKHSSELRMHMLLFTKKLKNHVSKHVNTKSHHYKSERNAILKIQTKKFCSKCERNKKSNFFLEKNSTKTVLRTTRMQF